MAISHANCAHPSTPAARGKCRKERRTNPPSDAGTLFEASQKATKRRKGGTVSSPQGGVVKASKRAAHLPRSDRDPDLVDTVHRLHGTVPFRSFDDLAHRAWDLGWKMTREGNPADRILIAGSKGQVTVVWAGSKDTHNVAYWFRPWETSVARKVASGAIAFALAEGRR